MNSKNFIKILYSYDEIIKSIKKLSFDLNGYYKSFENEEIVVITILDGSIVFTGNILPELDFNTIFKTVKVSVYGNRIQPKKNDFEMNENYTKNDISGHKVLVLDGLVDTGRTLELVTSKLKEYGASDIKTCTLFKKDPKNRKVLFSPDWFGLLIPNEWVAGFGMDSRDKYRNVKHLGIVKIDRR